jgi:hypothetical protein
VKKSRTVRDTLELHHQFNPLTNKSCALKGIPRHPRFLEVLNISEAARLAAGSVLQQTLIRIHLRFGSSFPLCFNSQARLHVACIRLLSLCTSPLLSFNRLHVIVFGFRFFGTCHHCAKGFTFLCTLALVLSFLESATVTCVPFSISSFLCIFAPRFLSCMLFED